MNKYEKLVDVLLDSPYKMCHHDIDVEEILMVGVPSTGIKEILDYTHKIYKKNYSFRVVHVYEECYSIYIYNKQDISDNLIKEQLRWEEKINEQMKLYDEYKASNNC